MGKTMLLRFVALAVIVLCASPASGREACEGGDSRAWSSTLPGGASVSWQMSRDLGGCRHVTAVVPRFPEGAAEAARTLGELAEALMLVGGDFSRGDLVGFCVAALAGGDGSNSHKRFHGRWSSATCKVGKAELTFTLYVDTDARRQTGVEAEKSMAVQMREERRRGQAADGAGEVVADTDFRADGDYEPIVQQTTIFTRMAQRRGIEGYVLVEYVVTATGAVRNPVVVEAKPPGIFDKAAVDAALKFKFRPRVVNGKPVDAAGARTLLRFAVP